MSNLGTVMRSVASATSAASGIPRVLVAEADQARRADLIAAVRDEDLELVSVSTAAAALSLLAPPDDFAVAIVALDLPDADGIGMIARLRAAGVRIPLLLAAHAPTDSTVVHALDAGASDVIAAPFRPALLRAQVRAQLRARLRGLAAAEEMQLAIGPYRFDIESRALHDPHGRRTRLTEKEAALLRYLLRAGGRPVARDELLREVWGYVPGVRSHTVATHIHRLRRKMEAGGPPLFVNDEWGYRLHHAWQPERAATTAPQAAVESLIKDAVRIFSDAARRGLSPMERGDIADAGRSLAFGLPAAALFHAFRAADSVLRRYHRSVTGTDPKAQRQDWANSIENLRRYGADDTILTTLEGMKDVPRNPLLHPCAGTAGEKARSFLAAAERVIGAMVAEIHAYDTADASGAPGATGHGLPIPLHDGLAPRFKQEQQPA